MIEAADRLIQQADGCQNIAAWHLEQATVGTDLERDTHERSAFAYTIAELSLRLTAEALEPSEATLDEEAA